MVFCYIFGLIHIKTLGEMVLNVLLTLWITLKMAHFPTKAVRPCHVSLRQVAIRTVISA